MLLGEDQPPMVGRTACLRMMIVVWSILGALQANPSVGLEIGWGDRSTILSVGAT